MGLDMSMLCVSYAYVIRHLVCTVVVEGLDNFQVGVHPGPLRTGLVVSTAEYALCSVGGMAAHNPIVVAGNEIEVVCDTATIGRWVIIQSLDTGVEKLCLAEVVIEVFGEYVRTGAASNTAHNELLMVIFCRITIADKVGRQCPFSWGILPPPV